jgi:hypothetical protein
MNRRISIGAFLLLAASASAQENRLEADFRGEGERFSSSCESGFSFSAIASCGELLFTDDPLHIAVGSLAPGNGVGLGLSLVGHWTTENWRNNWDFDAVGTPNGSWRAGGYLTLVYVERPKITVSTGTSSKPAPKSNLSIKEQPVIRAYAETTSLNSVKFFGLGPSTPDTPLATFGERETITGGNVVWPIWKRFNASLLGEANGRFVDIFDYRFNSAITPVGVLESAPPTSGTILDIAGAGFAQFGQGLRLRPTFANDYVRLNYTVNFQEFIGTSNTSFRRFTTDLQHQIALYRNTSTNLPHDFNAPDSCTTDVSDTTNKCPPLVAPAPPGKTRNLEGSIGLRLLIQESIVPTGNVVPFYFQPTLGGSDINGNIALGSFQDFRFRAPNLMLFRASFEHSIYKWPLGVTAMIDEGKVALNRSDIDFSHLRHSYSAGLTLRAGGFPLVYLLFSWGGGEGTRTAARIDTSLLGGTPHPSLF